MSTYKLKKGVVDNLESSLSGKSSTDLDNLSQTGEAHFANPALTNSPYTTNSILEIPQDIKLELNNGTLTLKAGSKVYVPNGFEADGVTPKFDVITVENDIEVPSDNSTTFIYYIRGSANFDNNIDSGTTFPSNPEKSQKFYKIDENCIYRFDGTNWNKHSYSLPLGFCKKAPGSNNIVSIDQVFNGFGYIGSTVFALPGVKVQIPNGRNEDGTLKSIEHTNSSVITTQEAGNKNSVNLVLTTTAIGGNIVYDYDEKTNYCFRNDTGAIYTDRIIIGKISVSSGKVTSIEPFTVDSVVNSNEFYQLKDKAVTTDTAQTISGSKRFTQPPEGMSIDLVADTNQQIVPTVDGLRQLGLYRNSTYTKGDGYTSWLQAVRGSDGWTETALFVRRFLESDSQEIINYLKVDISPDGIPVAHTRTPPAGVAGEEIVTAGWVNSKIQLVNELPANPVAGVLYCIPEK